MILKFFIQFNYLIPTLLSTLFLLAGILTLTDYGINWDAPNRMIRGQNFLSIFLGQPPKIDPEKLSPILIQPREYVARFDLLEGEEGELTKLPERPAPQYFEGNFYNDDRFREYFSIPWGHPPLVDILAALSNRILHGFLGVLGEIQSYQVLYLILSAVGIFVTSAFAFDLSQALNPKDKSAAYMTAIIAGLSLAFYPYFFAESHFNMKDPPQAAMFTGTLWAFWKWIKFGKTKFFWLSLGFAAFGACIKWNLIFLPVILIPWLFLIRNSKQFKTWFKPGRLLILSGIGLLIISLMLVITWPGGISDPLRILGSYIEYYFKTGTKADPLQPPGFIIPGGFNLYPLTLLITQTPEIILLLSLVGIFWVIRSKGLELKVGYLLLLWLLVPIARVSLPHFWFYNGLRQIMEVLPALAILTGIGTTFVVSIFKYQASKRFKSSNLIMGKWSEAVFVLIFVSWLFFLNLLFHPNQNVYFNGLVGGLSGAEEMKLVDRKITYGSIYKQAADWLNQNANKDANVALLDGPMFALSPLLLRPDISISPFHFSGLDQKGEYIMTLHGDSGPVVFASKYPQVFLKPIHKIQVDGVTLLSIYRNDPTTSILKTKEELTNNYKLHQTAGPNGIQLIIDLGQPRRVTRIKLTGLLTNCRQPFVQYVDEFIEFENGTGYGMQERNVVEDGVEFLFPAETSRFIKITPFSHLSCFLRAKVSSVSFLKP